MQSQILTAVIAAAIVAVGILVVQAATDGGLVRLLGGATVEQVESLRCEALPAEEHQPQPRCQSGFPLAEWCSGDCGGDDARVTLCCSYR